MLTVVHLRAKRVSTQLYILSVFMIVLLMNMSLILDTQG